MAIKEVDRFYSKHPNVRKIVLLSYEIAIGLMLYLALRYANDSYALGAKDCFNAYRKVMNISIGNITFGNLSLNPETLIRGLVNGS